MAALHRRGNRSKFLPSLTHSISKPYLAAKGYTIMTREERPAIWLQKEIRADEVARKAREMGLTVVQDLCAYEIHMALVED